MASLIKTQTTKYLTADYSGKTILIQGVAAENLTAWCETLTKEQQKWVKDNHFTAAKDEQLKLSEQDGALSKIVIGQGDSSATSQSPLTTYAKLAKSLPAGHYQLGDQSFSDLQASDKKSKLSIIGWALSQYVFDRYQQKKNQHNAVLVLENKQLLEELSTIINGITLVRDLINTPTCDMGPSHLSAVMKELAETYQAEFSEVVGDELLQRRFNTIHAVGRAAKNLPRLLEMTWGREGAPKLTLVGKGVCFDTGGLDMKSSAGMRVMKKDMGGAAHTLGIASMIMANGLDVRLRLLIPAVENNISADAFRPGDIITTYKGTTVEIDNTDAEGRLVLCDALALASEEDPDLLINFATLTGAARVAMGTDIVPFFTDNDELAAALSKQAILESDPMWRMPLYAPYEAQLKSNFADLRNMSSAPYGGAIIAALYLKHFVEKPDKWIHFDMYAWNVSENATCAEGGEAMAIRGLFSYLQQRFATKQ